MEIKVLGTRGEIEEFSPEHKKHSGILIDYLMFDIGEEEYLEYKPKVVFITHLHPDHVFFLKSGKEKAVDPEKYSKVSEITFFSPEIPEGANPDKWIKITKDSIDIGSFIITPIPTIHSKKVKSVGYLIQSGFGRVFYSSDMIWIRKKYHDLLRDLDLVITDGSFIKEGEMIRRDKETGEVYGHSSIPNLYKLFSKLGAKKIVFSHFGSWMMENPKAGKEKVKQLGENVEIAKDGSTFHVSSHSLNEELAKEICVPGIEYDLEHAKERWRELNADHRYLHIGYIKIKNGGSWGDWTLERIIKCHARIVDRLRSLYFPYIPAPKERPNLRELDLKSREIEKTSPPETPEEVQKWNAKRREIVGESEEMKIEGLEKIGTEEVKPVTPKKIAEVGPERGIYLVEPHAKWIASGFKTAFVKSKKYDINENEGFYLLGDHLCYGIIWVSPPEEITLEEFKKREEQHRIDEETRKKWCEEYKEWCTGPLYFYKIVNSDIWAVPIPISVPKGVQTFVKKENIKFENVKALPTGRIKKLHSLAHELKNIKLHELAKKELINRNIEHEHIDELDRLQEFLIQDWKTYDPMELIKTTGGKKVLLDDHRIVHAWWSILKRGKKLESPQFKDYSLEEQKKIVKELYRKIVQAMKVLGYKYSPLREDLSLDEELEEIEVDQKPKEIQVKDLESIDDVYVKELSDEDLIRLDKRLHEIYRELKKVTEPLHNAHVFVWSEMVHRDIEHEIEDPLTTATALEVVEYPTPRGFASKDVEEKDHNSPLLPLERILNAFPERFTLQDPPAHIHLCGSSVNKERSLPGHDIDVLIKQAYPDKRLIKEFFKAIRSKDPEVAERISLVFDPHGPQIGWSIPLYRISFERTSPEEWRKHSPWEYLAGLEVGKPIRALKASTGFNKNEFFDAESLWNNWAADRISKGIVIQKKYDGIRFHIHRKGDKVWIITEDRQRDRSSVFKKSVKELLENVKSDNFVLDAEMVEYDCKNKKVKDKEEFCEAIEREEMIPWVVAEKRELDDENIVFHIHDCMIADGKDITQKPYIERWETAKKILGDKQLEHFRIVPSCIAKSKNEFDRCLAKMRRIKGSEGAMLKVVDSTYKLTGRTSEWCLTGGSYILTENGFEQIAFVKEGTRVFSKDGKLHRIVRKIRRQILPFEELYDVKDYHGLKVRATGNHEVLTRTGWIESASSNQQVPAYPRLEIPKEEPPKELILDWHGYKKIISCNQDFWKFIGFWIAEGSLGSNKKRHKQGELYFSQKDSKIFSYYSNLADRIFQSSGSVYNYSGLNIYYIYDPPFCKWLSTYFLDENCDKTVPWFIGSLDEDSFNAFWQGWCDGDRRDKEYNNISTSDRGLAGRMFAILNSKGYDVSITYSKTRGRDNFTLAILTRPAHKINCRRAYTDRKDFVYDLEVENEDSFLTGNLVLHNSKIKNVKELDVMVWEVVPKKDSKTGKIIPGQYMYDCVFAVPCNMKNEIREKDFIEYEGKCYAKIGRSYSTAVKASRGDIITVTPIRVAEFEEKGKKYWTWMFPVFKAKHPTKHEPDNIGTVRKLVSVGTAPLTSLAEEVVRLPTCPFWLNDDVCPLKWRFAGPVDFLTKKMYLRFPVACSLAYYWKCRYVKNYYYDYMEEDKEKGVENKESQSGECGCS